MLGHSETRLRKYDTMLMESQGEEIVKFGAGYLNSLNLFFFYKREICTPLALGGNLS